MNSKVPRSLRELTAPFRKLEPEECVDLTRKQLDAFAMQIAGKGHYDLAVPYGKAYFLFNSMLQYLKTCNFTVCLLKSLSNPDRLMLKQLGQRKSNEIAILVDSIREGREIKKLYSKFEKSGRRVKWIFSFLTNSKGLKQLKSEGFPVSKIVSCKTVEPSEYLPAYGRILVYLQSRIEPLVEGAPFDVYSTEASMKEEVFLAMVTKAFSSALRCKDFKPDPDDWLHTTSGIHSYSYECDKINDCHNNDDLFTDIPRIGKLDFEASKYGIKVDCSQSKTTFRLAALSPINCSLKGIVPSDPRKCPYKPMIERMATSCQVSVCSQNQRSLARKDICPTCVGLVVSTRVLDLVKKEVDASLQRQGINFSSYRCIPT